MDKKKVIVICIICVLLGGLLIGGTGILIYRELSQNESSSGDSQSADDQKADQLADGESYDFEQAGYIKLGTYKGLEAQVEPEDEDVYSEMIAVAEETETSGDDVVKKGDLVNIDFSAKLDGEELEDASGEDTYLIVGKGEYIDDFENGLIGIKNGKKKTVDCTFPSDYEDEDLAGKTVQFTLKVNGRFGDETAKKASEDKYTTVQEYYDYEKETQRKDNSENKGDLVWDTLKEDTEIETAPETMLTRAQEDITTMYTNFAELSGMTLSELLESFGMDEDGIDEIASDTVADYMIAKTIAAKEGITMDDDYYRSALKAALAYDEDEESDEELTIESLETEYKESQGSRPKDDMLIERVKDYVGEQSTEA